MYWSVDDVAFGAAEPEERVVSAFPRRGSTRRLTRPALLHAALLTIPVVATAALVAVLVLLAR